jgi:ParB family chromosome partitioning protein
MEESTTKNKDLTLILKITDLKESPWQTRFDKMMDKKDMTVLKEDTDQLAASIERSGMMQPVLVRPVEEGYEIIDGHRRIQALKKLGRGQAMCIIKDVDDREAQVIHVVSNIHRKNLKPIELALTYQKMLESKIFKDKRELSTAIGKDETYVGDLLATLQLDERIIEDLAKNNSIKDLRLLRLIRLHDPVDENGKSDAQRELYQKVIFQKLSRKQVANLVKKPEERAMIKTWKMQHGRKNITISLETGVLNQAQKEMLMKLISEKMKEISDTM